MVQCTQDNIARGVRQSFNEEEGRTMDQDVVIAPFAYFNHSPYGRAKNAGPHNNKKPAATFQAACVKKKKRRESLLTSISLLHFFHR